MNLRWLVSTIAHHSICLNIGINKTASNPVIRITVANSPRLEDSFHVMKYLIVRISTVDNLWKGHIDQLVVYLSPSNSGVKCELRLPAWMCPVCIGCRYMLQYRRDLGQQSWRPVACDAPHTGTSSNHTDRSRRSTPQTPCWLLRQSNKAQTL